MDYVYDEKGRARSHLQFLVNGRNTTILQGLVTKLVKSDKVTIIPLYPCLSLCEAIHGLSDRKGRNHVVWYVEKIIGGPYTSQPPQRSSCILSHNALT